MSPGTVVSERTLGVSGIKVSALGLGTWAIGGLMTGADGRDTGWGAVDDDVSVAALRRAFELGVTLYDTADTYGAGHAEKILSQALGAHREEIVVATKFGWTFDEGVRRGIGMDVSPAYMRHALEASLRRLGTDWVDLYQLHVGELGDPEADEVAATLEQLLKQGKIRAFGWSTDNPERAARWGERGTCSAVQHNINVFQDAPAVLEACQRYGMASVNRGPLGSGFLTGKYGTDGVPVGEQDWRRQHPDWLPFFQSDGQPRPEWVRLLDAVREVLTSDGRTVAQGAIGWLWARSPLTIPIPGVKTVAQAEDNAGALAKGPLSSGQMNEIRDLRTSMAPLEGKGGRGRES
ncbi:MAG TPA: aldo/keto reductase, partial [Acidimicrobiales bacterium]|nr:aldo/keto reductase [Acidimicrobiales bacterium]